MAGKVYQIAFELAGENAGFIKSMKAAEKSVGAFSAQMAAFEKNIAINDKIIKLKTEVGNAARTFLQSKQRVEELGRSFAESKAKTEALRREFESTGGKSAELKQKLKEAENATKQLGNELNKERSKLKNAENALNTKRQALDRLKASNKTAGQSIQEITRRNDELRRAAERAAAAQEKLAKVNELQGKLKAGAASSAGSLVAIGAGVAAGVGAPVKLAMNMQESMAEIAKVTDFDAAGLEQVRKELEMMSTRIPISAEGLASIFASAAQSGVAQKDLMEFTEQAAKMGTAFDITAEEAGVMMSKWRSGMGLTMEKTYQLADAVNALSNVNAATAPQIGEVLKRYGALGKVAGLTEKETAAFAASVVASGAEAEVAATGIKAFMRAMGKGGAMSAKQEGYFDAVGIDPIALQKKLQKDAPAAIISVLETIQKEVPKDQWNEYLSKMFGEEAAVAVGPMMTNLEGLKNNFKMVADSASYSGSMLAEFKSRASTTSNALTLAKNAALYAARAIGQPLLGPLKEVAEKFVGIAVKVGNWISKNEKLVLQIMKIGGTLLGVVTAFHALRIAIYYITSPFLTLYKGILLCQKAWALYKTGVIAAKWATVKQTAAQVWQKTVTAAQTVATWAHTAATKIATAAQWLWTAAMNTSVGSLIAQKVSLIASKVALIATKGVMALVTAAQWAWNAAMTANPIGLVIAAIAALIAAGVLLYKNWDKIKAAAASLWSSIKKFFGKIGDYITGIWDKIKGIWGKITGFFGGGKKTVNVNAAGGGVKIPQMASGGIATKPTLAMIGEGREKEAVLPLSKLENMLNGGGNGGGITVHFAPVINVSGGTGNSVTDMEKGLRESVSSLEKALERIAHNKKRLSYI